MKPSKSSALLPWEEGLAAGAYWASVVTLRVFSLVFPSISDIEVSPFRTDSQMFSRLLLLHLPASTTPVPQRV